MLVSNMVVLFNVSLILFMKIVLVVSMILFFCVVVIWCFGLINVVWVCGFVLFMMMLIMIV